MEVIHGHFGFNNWDAQWVPNLFQWLFGLNKKW
jgi:hypothetical protein